MRRLLISCFLGFFAASLPIGCGSSGPTTAPAGSGPSVSSEPIKVNPKGPRATKIEKAVSAP